MTETLAILVCDYLRREAQRVVAEAGWEDVVVETFPAEPDRRHPEGDNFELPEKVRLHGFDCIELFGGCCTHGSAQECGISCRFNQRQLCFEYFLPKPLLDVHYSEGAHLMTPGQLADWRGYLARSGFRQEDARDFFQETTSALVLLDTGVDGDSTAELVRFSEHVGVPYRVLPTGLEMFALLIKNRVARWHHSRELASLTDRVEQANHQSADYAMAFDLISSLAEMMDEATIVRRMVELFSMLFAPASLAVLTRENDGIVQSFAQGLNQDASLWQQRLSSLAKDYAWTESEAGFRLALRHGEDVLGGVELDGLAFPEQRERYLNIALSLGHVCGLAISNARQYDALKRTQEILRRHEDQLELLVKERTRALSLANDDLAQFATAASHSLQEPLRRISSYTQLLGRRYRGQLDDDADEMIDYSVSGALRLQELIDSLLRYSSIGTREEVLTDIDCNELLDQVVENVEDVDKEQVTRGTLPVIKGNAKHLQLLFGHLIANAIKYRSERPLQIDVRAEWREEMWCFSVQDNGIGIAERHQGRIFDLFKRLHRESEYPGVGVGLAMCKKIISLYEGEIWVESEVGRGSTFYFSYP